MKTPLRRTRLMSIAALTAFACAAASSSAMASVSIEPLNTKFSGHASGTTTMTLNGVTTECTSVAFAGTTNSTKTNYVNITPTFSKCTDEIASLKREVTITSSCAKEGTVPWTYTLNEVGTEHRASLRLNCALLLKRGTCTMTIAEQTSGETSTAWRGTTSLELVSSANGLTTTVNQHCEEIGLAGGKTTLGGLFVLEGIHAT
jgi:hypothetical protein